MTECYNNINVANGDKAPLLSDEVYDIIMKVSSNRCPAHSRSNLASSKFRCWYTER